MKPCMTCENKPTKNGIYKAHLENFVVKNLPKDNKCYHNKDKDTNKIKMSKLKPNKTIFYFATNDNDFTKNIKPQIEAYENLKNSGVTIINKDGEGIAYLKCPQLYSNTDGNIYSRHIHFLYWDDNKGTWDNNLYTQQVLCDVNEEFVKKYMKKSIIIDARSAEYYNKSHVKGAINLPYDKRWNEKSVLEELKKGMNNYDGNKLVPIILYCAKNCNASNKLYQKLNKLGFYNTMHAEGNLLSLKK
jgi:rhodanese-related sulfurtransferase